MDELRRKIRYQVMSAFVAILIALFHITADPFALATTTDRLSSLLFSALLSPFYGREVVSSDDSRTLKGRDEIVVLLFDDQYLEHRQWRWPLKPRIYRQWLERIAEAEPNSIFVDLYFIADSSRRSRGLASLYRSGQDIEEDLGVPVFFSGVLSNPEPAFEGQMPGRVALAEMKTEHYQYALRQPVEAGGHRATAAYALYEHWCETRDCSTFHEGSLDKRMFVQWGYAPEQKMAEYYGKQGVSCQRETETLIRGVGQSLYLFVLEGLNGFSGQWRPPCLYHTHVSFLLVESLSSEQLKEFLKDKIVLIGADLNQHPDLKESSVHGYVPGVFWHAMALDNLIEFGDGFLHEDQSDASDINEALATAFIIIVFTAFSIFSELRYEKEAVSEQRKVLISFYFGMSVMLVLSVAIASLIYVDHRAPTNWIGIAGLLFLVNPEPFAAVFKVSWYRFGRPLMELEKNLKPLPLLVHSLMSGLIFSVCWSVVLILFIGPLVFFSVNPQEGWAVYFSVILVYTLLLCIALRKLSIELSISTKNPSRREDEKAN